MQSAPSWAPKVARRCESKHWYACGADGRSQFDMEVVAHRGSTVVENRVQIVESELSCLWRKGWGE